MAEVFGLAAGVAGFVGLTGQAAEGWVFLKSFIHDVKHAPEEITFLSNEIELVDKTARKVGALILRSRELNINITGADYKATLEQCHNSVNAVGLSISSDVSHFNHDKMSWRQRLKAAAGKKLVMDYIGRSERAKTQLLMIQGIISSELQYVNHDALLEIKTSVESTSQLQTNTNTGIIQLCEQNERIMSHLDSYNGSFQNRVQELGTLVNDLQTSRQQQSVLVTREMIVEACSTAIQMYNLPLKPQENRERQVSEREPPTRRKEALKNDLSSRQLAPDSASIAEPQQRRLKSTHINVALFDLNLTTRSNIENASDVDEVEARHFASSTSTEVHLRFKLWGFKKGIHMRFSTSTLPYDPGVDMKLGVYNFVSEDSSIIEACENLDFKTVRYLFDNRLATPYDFATTSDRSLLDVVMDQIISHTDITSRQMETALHLLRYIVQCSGRKGLRTSTIRKLLLSIRTSSFFAQPALTTFQESTSEAIRLLLTHTIENPFHRDSGVWMTLRERQCVAMTPLVTHGSWQYNWENLELFPNVICENDYLILQDISGHRMYSAITQGKLYLACFTYPYFSLLSKGKRLHNLLLIAHTRENDTLLEGCMSRWSHLLELGYSPEIEHHMGIDKYGRVFGSITAYGFAALLGYGAEFEQVLLSAGWTSSDVDELQDVELYLGLPELLDGELVYMNRMECRLLFIEELITGGLGSEEAFFDAVEIGNSIGSYVYAKVYNTISNAKECFTKRRHHVPGAWPLDEDPERLVPGEDFYWDLDWDFETCLNYSNGLIREDGETARGL